MFETSMNNCQYTLREPPPGGNARFVVDRTNFHGLFSFCRIRQPDNLPCSSVLEIRAKKKKSESSSTLFAIDIRRINGLASLRNKTTARCLIGIPYKTVQCFKNTIQSELFGKLPVALTKTRLCRRNIK